MKCNDCEFEVDKVNIDGICKDCAHKKAQAKYAGRPYIKIKDRKGTNWYNILLERRAKKGIYLSKDINPQVETKTIKAKIEEFPKIEIKEKEPIIVDNKEIAKKVVDTDIEDRIKKLNINKDLVQLPLEMIIQSFIKIFDKSAIHDKTLLKNEYEIFIIDRLHKLLFTEDVKEIAQIGLEQKYIEEKRCELKRELSLYSPFRELIDELMSDEVFKTKFDIAVEKYEEMKNKYDNYKYMTNTLSMQELDFTIPGNAETLDRKLAERKTVKKYYASVPCNNLYGNTEKTLFETKNPILAESEEQAKEILKTMLKQFKGAFYNEKDIIVREC